MARLSFKDIHSLLARFERMGHVPLGAGALTGEGEGEVAQVGQGDDFHSFGRYRDGDDIRLVDWGSYARTRKLWSRRFTTNRTKRLLIAIDGSGSMSVGEYEKWHVSTACALLLHALTLQSGYQAEIVVFGEHGVEKVPTGTDGSILDESFEWLAHYECSGTTLLSSLHTLEVGTGGELCVISDFMWRDVRSDLSAMTHVVPLALSLIRVTATADSTIPMAQFVDPETGRVGAVPRIEQAQMQSRLDDFRNELVMWSQENGTLCFDWCASQFDTAMQQWLINRHRFSSSGAQ
jgi:uncharacterized protein (DUF58 family)